jgi:hypothetical protein
VSAIVACVVCIFPRLSHAWSTEVVDTSLFSGHIGRGPVIAIDRTGAIHISSVNATLSACQYSTNASGSWTTSVMDAEGGGSGDIAIDTFGNAHLAYSSSATVKYATNVSGSWVTTAIRPVGTASPYIVSLALDNLNNAHLVYGLYVGVLPSYDARLVYAAGSLSDRPKKRKPRSRSPSNSPILSTLVSPPRS